MEIALFKFAVSSALVTAIYWLLLRNKASYKFSRIYLLAMPLACLAMSTIRIEVWEPDTMATTSIVSAQKQTEYNIITTDNLGKSGEGVSLTTRSSPENKPALANYLVDNWKSLVIYSISFVSTLLSAKALIMVAKILRQKSRMKASTTQEGYYLVKDKQIQAPFSFGKTIFLPESLSEGKAAMIINHEKAHIAHNHYIDVWVSEFMARIFWFNPFVWICRNELRKIHEFEADRDVIMGGVNIKSYQTTLLEMVMNESTSVVSGFNHSFIRRRFIEMKRSTAGTLGKLGKCLSAAMLASVFCSCTFTDSVVKAPEKDSTASNESSIATAEPGYFEFMQRKLPKNIIHICQ